MSQKLTAPVPVGLSNLDLGDKEREKSNLSWRFILMSYINENWRTDVRKQNIKYKFVFLDDEVFEEVGLRTHACSK